MNVKAINAEMTDLIFIILFLHLHVIHGNLDSKYIGCFEDSPNRVLETFYPMDLITIEKCVEKCMTKGHLYAGAEHGLECWCGNRKPLTSLAAPEGECNDVCEGNLSQMCGGAWRLSVYDIDQSTLTTPFSETTTEEMSTSAIEISTTTSCCCASYTLNITNKELNIKLLELKKHLKVQKKETSQYKAKKISAADNRPSATYTGIILGASVLISLGLLIVISDIVSLFSKTK